MGLLLVFVLKLGTEEQWRRLKVLTFEQHEPVWRITVCMKDLDYSWKEGMATLRIRRKESYVRVTEETSVSINISTLIVIWCHP